MSVSSDINEVQANGNGVTLIFNFPHYFLEANDLKVLLTDTATDAVTDQILNTDYTVTGAGVAGGGSITFAVAPATGKTVTIINNPDLLQESEFEDNSKFPAKVAEKAWDKLTIITQRLNERVNNSITLPDGFVGTFSTEFPSSLTANSVLGINEDADRLKVGPTFDEISNAQGYATAAEVSKTAAQLAETNAEASEISAASSAASAAATLASAFFRSVVTKTSSDSPITIDQTYNGKLLELDSSGGAIVVNYPAISSLTLPFNVAFKLSTAGNTVTFNRGSTDLIDGTTSITLSTVGTGLIFAARAANWTSLPFGTIADNSISTAKIIDGSITSPKFNSNAFVAPSVQSFLSGSGTAGLSYAFIVSSASATAGATYTNNAITFTVLQTISGATLLYASGTGAPASSGTLTKASGTGDSTITFSSVRTPKYLEIEMCGAGAGGVGGDAGGTGTSGGNSTFGSSLLTANGGSAGAGVLTPGAGGSFTVNAPAIDIGSQAGGYGVGGQSSAGSALVSGSGGGNFYGPGGAGVFSNAGTGRPGIANTGGGGAGGASPPTGGYAAPGGGAGAVIRAIIPAPSSSYSYAVGAGGSGGAGSGSGGTGGAGAAGRITVKSFYQ